MTTRTTTRLDVSMSSSTDNLPIYSGPISIQPILDSITGSPTYTVEVSNDGLNFTSYTASSRNVSIVNSVEITYEKIPWKFIRVTVSPSGTGYVYFYISQGGNLGPT